LNIFKQHFIEYKCNTLIPVTVMAKETYLNLLYHTVCFIETS